MYISIALFAVELAVWAYMLYCQFRSRNLLFVTFLVSFAMHYVFPLFHYFPFVGIENRYYSLATSFTEMLACTLVFLFAVNLGQTLYLKKSTDEIGDLFYGPSEMHFKPVKFILLLASLSAIALQYQGFQYLMANELMANRLIYNSGKGYLQFLNVTSYFLVFIGVKQYCEGKISLKYLVLHAVPAFVIYSLKLQRGHSLYPLFMIFVVFIYTKLSVRKASILLAVVIASLYSIGAVTGAIRQHFVSNTTDEFEMAQISSEETIPDSYAHAELLSSVIDDPAIDKMGNSVVGSLVNIVPRALYPDKPSSLGPTLNALYSPETTVFADENLRRSSYTTDLLIEGFYNMGYFGVFLLGLLYAFFAQKVWLSALRNRSFAFLTIPLALYIWGYTIYFSDLGNWLGYIVIYYGIYFIVKLCIKHIRSVGYSRSLDYAGEGTDGADGGVQEQSA